ncbi:hypothetical protein NKG05_04420 [Oerskovia sp. M15]
MWSADARSPGCAVRTSDSPVDKGVLHGSTQPTTVVQTTSHHGIPGGAVRRDHRADRLHGRRQRGHPAADDAARTFALVGSLQDEAGCAADWDPTCAATELAPTGTDGIFSADFTVPAGTYEYKVAVNDAWDEAYGLNGGADNIPLVVGGPATLRFTFDDVAKRVSLAPVELGESTTRRPTRRS